MDLRSADACASLAKIDIVACATANVLSDKLRHNIGLLGSRRNVLVVCTRRFALMKIQRVVCIEDLHTAGQL